MPIEQSRPFAKIALVLAAIYLFYLACVTQTVLFFDALGYEQLGRNLAGQGWQAYFATGPNREPLYPWFISQAMRWGQGLGMDYIPLLMAGQVLCVIAMLCLLNKLLLRSGVGHILRAVIIIYAATSPAIVYTTFIVWSEVITYPLVLGFILISALAWAYAQRPDASWPKALAYGALMALMAFALTMVKAVVEMVGYCWVIPWVWGIWHFKCRLDDARVKMFSVVLLGFIVVFGGGIVIYKSLNASANGQFTIANRGEWALYGNTARRLAPLSVAQWQAAFLSIPHETNCLYWLKNEGACRYWTYLPSDELGVKANQELLQQGLTPPQANHALVRMALNTMAQHPMQAAVLMGVEGMKFMFWEYNARLEYVAYPRWVEAGYHNAVAYCWWRYGMALLSFAAFCWAMVVLVRHRAILLCPQKEHFKAITIMLFSWIFILYFTFFYSFFYCSSRYAMPLAPLFLCLIAAMVKFSIAFSNKRI